ncbi:MAG TPA: hypothetical protein VJ867_01540 [Gemmatimonadaceae bacterium]|nr:hypothetical protein [Gemmatimonadaceae bacterium]
MHQVAGTTLTKPGIGYVVATLAIAYACADVTNPEIIPDVRRYVTDSAALALDEHGRFHFPDTISGTAEGVPLVSGSYARELATAFVHSYGPAFLSAWQNERGGPIALSRLSAASRVYPAPTAFEMVPDVGCHPAFVRLFGSYYLLTFDNADEPQVYLAVSAQTTEYSVDQNGDLVEPGRTGQDFVSDGIPIAGGFITGPEQAVARAAQATSALINRVPQLVLRQNNLFAPTFALWRVSLDRQVNVARDTGAAQNVSTLYVGPDSRVYVPSAVQPRSVSQQCTLVDENLVNHGIDTIDVAVQSGKPIDFEPVTILAR